MRRLRSNHLREVVTFVLAMSVSVCCCQAHFLLHGFAAQDDMSAPAVAAESGDCCTNCDDAPGDDRPSAPAKGCKSCCVKGSGLKDGVTLPPPDIADVLAVTPAPPVLPATPAMFVAAQAAPPTPYVAPPTLLRLRCALIV